MSDLKKEIQKAIGETKSHKENVWRNIQTKQPKRKNRIPLFVTTALIAISCIWILLLQFPLENNQTTSMKIGVTNETKDGISYTFLDYENQKPTYVNNDYALSIAKNEQEYKALSEQLKLEYISDIDFTKFDILFALYTSDGCGLVIDKLTKSNNILEVHLALPVELRDKKELNCTTIAAPHLAVIEIEKQSIEQATFTIEGKQYNTAFNKLEINEMYYHFDLILNPDIVHSIEIQDLVHNKSIAIERDIVKNDLSKLISKAEPVSGIVDIVDPQYEIFVQTNDGFFQKVFLWNLPESNNITIMSSRDTHKIYTIPKSEAQFILSYLN